MRGTPSNKPTPLPRPKKQRGFLNEGEPHPAAFSAKAYITRLSQEQLYTYLEAFSSCSIENNRLAEVCAETLRRLINKESVSDRYLLGLAWTLKKLEK